MHTHKDVNEPARVHAKAAVEAMVGTLRQLPDEIVPPWNWQGFQSRARSRLQSPELDGRTRRVRVQWAYTTATATVLAFVIGIAVVSSIAKSNRVGSSVRGESAVIGATDDRDPTDAPDIAIEPALGSLRSPMEDSGWLQSDPAAQMAAARSVAVESWLASLPREPVVVRVGTRAAVAGLEDEIAQVDDLLTSVRLEKAAPDQLVSLQRERERLVGSLAQVRYAEFVAAASP